MGGGCQTDTKLFEFAMYRLNLWHRTGQGAIAATDWDKCSRSVLINDLRSYPVVLGLDLSRNRDMTAATLMFAVPTDVASLPQARLLTPSEEDEDEDIFTARQLVNIPHMVPFFFLPEATIPLYSPFIDLRELGEESSLKLVPGLTIRPETVATFINQLANEFDDFRVVASDPWRFKSVSAILKADHGWTDESLVGV